MTDEGWDHKKDGIHPNIVDENDNGAHELRAHMNRKLPGAEKETFYICIKSDFIEIMARDAGDAKDARIDASQHTAHGQHRRYEQLTTTQWTFCSKLIR